MMAVPASERDERLFAEVITDVLSSKVAGREELVSVRETVEELIEEPTADDNV